MTDDDRTHYEPPHWSDSLLPHFITDFNSRHWFDTLKVGDDVILGDSEEIEVPVRVSGLRFSDHVDGCIIIDFERNGPFRDVKPMRDVKKVLARELDDWINHRVRLKDGEEYPETFEAWLRYWRYLDE